MEAGERQAESVGGWPFSESSDCSTWSSGEWARQVCLFPGWVAEAAFQATGGGWSVGGGQELACVTVLTAFIRLVFSARWSVWAGWRLFTVGCAVSRLRAFWEPFQLIPSVRCVLVCVISGSMEAWKCVCGRVEAGCVTSAPSILYASKCCTFLHFRTGPFDPRRGQWGGNYRWALGGVPGAGQARRQPVLVVFRAQA